MRASRTRTDFGTILPNASGAILNEAETLCAKKKSSGVPSKRRLTFSSDTFPPKSARACAKSTITPASSASALIAAHSHSGSGTAAFQ